MKGNFHVQFLGGWGAAMLPGYPAPMEKEQQPVRSFDLQEPRHKPHLASRLPNTLCSSDRWGPTYATAPRAVQGADDE